MTGTLYLVGTPIGNLEDITTRAIKTLQSVDLIAAEDTRHTGKLLKYFQITTPQISYHDHNRQERTPELVARLSQGENIALVSDAGMPGISDPGVELVQACIAAGIAIVPIPGVTAAMTALVGSGLPTDRFVFEGFLPSKTKARCDRLQSLTTEPRTLIFYESPHRLIAMLTDLAAVIGADRPLTIARELTKLHEEFWRGTVGEAIGALTRIAHYTAHPPKGEFTLILAGATPPAAPDETDLKEQLATLMQQGMSRSAASRHLAQITGQPRRDIYQLALNLLDLET